MLTYIILATDGRHTMLGTTRPTPDETVDMGARLEAQGLGGWLAVMRGEYHAQRSLVTLMRCRPVTSSRLTVTDWHLAVSRAGAIRHALYPHASTRSPVPGEHADA